MSAYYNEIDPFAAQWLRNLIAADLIAPGDVDERSIEAVQPEDLNGYIQCHFFAGIGGWSRALRIAGWPDFEPIWTGSCPCQPFANCGRKQGQSDARHLWPQLGRLIAQCEPATILGEQVDSPLGRSWLANVLIQMETFGYDVAAAGLPAAGVGAPQIRGRLWWLADSHYAGWEGTVGQRQSRKAWQEWTAACGEFMRSDSGSWPPGPCEIDSIPQMVNGVSGVMGACKAYGNAIVPQVAAEFIAAYMECRP